MVLSRCAKWLLCVCVLCAAGVADASGATLTLQWDPSNSGSVAGYRVYVGTESGRYSTTVDVGSQLQFAFTAAEPGRMYYFAVAAYAPGGMVGPLSAEVAGRFGNGSLFLSNPGDVTSAVGTPAAVQLTASASFADAGLKYAASGLPPGLAIDAATGLIGGTAITAGTYRVTATVTNGPDAVSETFMWNVARHASTSPVLAVSIPTPGPKFTTSDAFVLIGGSADDDHGVTAVYWTNDRGGADKATGTSQWLAAVPLRPGRNEITITAADTTSNQSRVRLTVYRKTEAPANPGFGRRPAQNGSPDGSSTSFRD
jgi:hypothetical protein